MGKVSNLESRLFGRWVVLEKAGAKNRNLYYLCKCVCGMEKRVSGQSLLSGDTRSCGCLHSEIVKKIFTTHGAADTKEYIVWEGMRARCRNRNKQDFKNYGGRGIKVCDRWLNSFENFIEDMGLCPDGLTIERMDNDGNYSPKNCRWGTRKEQALNRRSNNVLVYRGISKTVSEWAEMLNVERSAIVHRLERGWSIEDTLEKPFENKKHKLVAFNGIVDTLTGWGRRLGGSQELIRRRLKAGWSMEKSLSTPNCSRT